MLRSFVTFLMFVIALMLILSELGIDFELATGTVEAVGLRSTRLRDINGTV